MTHLPVALTLYRGATWRREARVLRMTTYTYRWGVVQITPMKVSVDYLEVYK